MTKYFLACGFGRTLKSISAAAFQRTVGRSRSSFLHHAAKGTEVVAPLSSRGCHGHRSSAFILKRSSPIANITQTSRAVPHQLQSHSIIIQSRCFHVSQRRHIPPIFWIFLKPAAKLGAIISGRTARKWWQAQSDKTKSRFWAGALKRWYLLALAGAGAVGLGAAYYHSHVEQTPLTGRHRFIAVTHDQFVKIAEAEAQLETEKFEEKMLPKTNPYYERVTRVMHRLVQANPEISKLMGNVTWKCHVVNDPTTINAFVLPTGDIFVFTGILDFAHNDDQLAIILAHEMAHALLSHKIEQISYAQLLDIFIIITMAALWCVMPTDGISLVTQWFYEKIITLLLHMPYSRLLEKEADKVGLQLAAMACYDVREGSVFWTRIGLNENLTGSEDSIPEWLSTHPSYEKRVELFDFLVPKALELREGAKCAPLPKSDPRESIKILSAMVDEHLTAKRTGQNLSRVRMLTPGAETHSKSS